MQLAPLTTTTTTTLSIALLSLAATATALPSILPRAADPVAQLVAIAPTSTSCDNAPSPGECVTAAQAVGPLVASFAQYGVSTAAEQAALLSWMAFESGDFKYNHNVFPGVPGQGTRAMLSPAFVQMYAASIPALAAPAAALASNPAAVLALVQPDQYSFAAAAWFLTAVCQPDVRAQLQTGSPAGWTAWVTGCVQTTVTPARQAYWERAVAALGV